MNKLVANLKRLGACEEAVEWIATQSSLEQRLAVARLGTMRYWSRVSA